MSTIDYELKLESAMTPKENNEPILVEQEFKEGVLIMYGNGGKLGDLSRFAQTCKTDLIDKFSEQDIKILKVLYRDTFFSEIEKFGKKYKIKELHIFCHAYGCGLSLGFDLPDLETSRNAVWKKYRPRVPYLEVINAEYGILFTDNLVMEPHVSKKKKMQTYFLNGAMIEIWGCNSAVENHVFKDEVRPGYYTANPNEEGSYYWRAMNERNVPKPSIAKALARYFGVSVWGALSGSHVEVFQQGEWIDSNRYRDRYKRWPSSDLPVRLVPDKGDYMEFKE